MPFGISKLLLDDLGLNLQIRQLIPEALVVNAQLLPFLLPISYLLLEQDPALDADVVFGLHVLQGRGGVPGLALVVIVGNFNISKLELQSAVRFPQGGNFFLQVVLHRVAFGFRLLVFALPAQC